jgi:arylsulfatase A-like enzyme
MSNTSRNWGGAFLLRAACALAALATACSAAPVAKPNLLVIFTDDLDFEEVGALAKYGDAALAGNAHRREAKPLTPNLDRLIDQSQVFTQFHVASVVCTPSRYALLTGQYCSRSTSLQAKHPVSGPACVEFNTDILPGQWHLALGLKAAGYTTGIVGKWHNTETRGTPYHVEPPICDYTGKQIGPQDPTLPENALRVSAAYDATVKHLRDDIGWDYVSSIYIGNANQLGLPKPLWAHESNMEWFTAGALKFLDQQKGNDKPFFLYFAPNIPHGGGGEKFAKADPRATPEGLVDWHLGVQPSRADVLRRVRAAGCRPNVAWATWLDDGVGAILKRLDALGLAENTAVIFSSDQQSHGKWTCYEGARVPLAVRWPGRLKPGTPITALLNSIDFAPTLLELAGAMAPAASEAILDGRSFAPLLTGGSLPERPVLIEMGYGRAVISGGWKYIACRYPEVIEAQAKQKGHRPDFLGRFKEKGPDESMWPSFGEADQLFNLVADPQEQKNLAADPACAARLTEMKALLKSLLSPLPHVFGEFKAN